MNTNLNFGSVSTDQLAVTADLMNAMPSLELSENTGNHRLGKKIAGAGLAVALSTGVIAHQGNENSAFAADYETSVTAPLSEATAGPSRETSKPAEVRNQERFITADHAEYIELERDADGKLYMPIGVVGEKPCGPQVDVAEAMRRMEAGEVIVKPDETADFLNKNPQVEQGLNARYDEKSHGDTEWIDFLIDELDIKNDDILQGGEDAGVRGLKARSEAAVLAQDINVENNACDLETGKIFANPGPNNAYNHLQKGEQVWAINIPQDTLEKMEKNDVQLPKELIVVLLGGGKGAEIILERLSCNNPLFDLEQPPVEQPPVTTVETTVPEDSTTTTTTPNTTTSSTTSTTTPGTTSSTTSTTMPTTTSSSTTSTTTPSTTSSTTSTTSTTSTSTTSTTVPHTTTSTTTIPTTTSIRPEVTVPTQSSVIAGEGHEGAPDYNSSPEDETTTSQVTTTTVRPNPSVPTTTIRPANTTPSTATSTTIGHSDIE